MQTILKDSLYKVREMVRESIIPFCEEELYSDNYFMKLCGSDKGGYLLVHFSFLVTILNSNFDLPLESILFLIPKNEFSWADQLFQLHSTIIHPQQIFVFFPLQPLEWAK